MLITESHEIAECFNNHFLKVATNLQSSRTNQAISNSDFPFLFTNHISQNFFIFPVTPDELYQKIQSLKNKSSSGVDEVNSIVIKKVAINLVDVLCYIINKSFETGIFPNSLKTALVIPIFKKGDPNNPDNYRPISLVSVFSKIIESCMKSRLINFLQKHKFLSDCQFGFREKLNTEDALIQLLNQVYSALNVSDESAVNFIDIKKAFDTVDFEILLKKLNYSGIRGVSNNWFRSYLIGRDQTVKISKISSTTGRLTAGVPQGTVLGPILFLVYLNSIFDLKLNGSFVAFADDMAIFYRDASQNTITQKINEDLRKLKEWFDLHSMVMSNKTKLMRFKVKENNLPGKVEYHCSTCYTKGNTYVTPLLSCPNSCFEIECVEEFKYLGVILDSKLNFKKHVEGLRKYVVFCNRQMYELRSKCPNSVLIDFYYGLIQSRLQYGISCWGGTYLNTIKPILIAQKFIMRTMFKKTRYTSSLPLFKSNNILPIRYLYIYKVLKIFFLRSGNRNIKVTKYMLRNKSNCPKPQSWKESFRRYFLATSPMLYNKLPEEIKNITLLSGFLREVRAWLFSFNEVNAVETLLRVTL